MTYVARRRVVLRLEASAIGDRGMQEIARLMRLEFLDLRDTAVSDRSIAVLRNMQSLRELRLAGTKISRPGAKELSAALPHCAIDLVRELSNP